MAVPDDGPRRAGGPGASDRGIDLAGEDAARFEVAALAGKELFIAVVNRAFDRVLAALTEAAEGSGSDAVLASLGRAFQSALAEHGGELLQMQLYAACGDDEVRFAVRRRFADCYRYVERASGAPPDEVRSVFADAVLRSVAAAMRLSELPSREAWARRMLGSAR